MAEEKKLSEKTLHHVFNRHYQLLGCFNYERQMSTGYCYTMMPALKELYKDDPEGLKAAVKRHLEFYNCATSTSPFLIGLTCAMEAGNVLGPIIYALINVIPSEVVRRVGFKIGYDGGSKFLERISSDGTLQKVTEAARIMGLMVIGAMIPSMVTLTLGATIDINGAQVVLQEIIDQICPFILPLGLVGGCYSLLKKGKSGTAVMFGLLVLGIVLVALGLV